MHTVRIPSDDIVLGDGFRPREGQWVEVRAASTVDDIRLQLRLGTIQAQIAAREDSGDVLTLAAQVEQLLDQIAARIVGRVVAWNWRDEDGDPLPSPPDTETLMGLSIEEFVWLLSTPEPVNPKDSTNSNVVSERRVARRRKRGS